MTRNEAIALANSLADEASISNINQTYLTIQSDNDVNQWAVQAIDMESTSNGYGKTAQVWITSELSFSL